MEEVLRNVPWWHIFVSCWEHIPFHAYTKKWGNREFQIKIDALVQVETAEKNLFHVLTDSNFVTIQHHHEILSFHQNHHLVACSV